MKDRTRSQTCPPPLHTHKHTLSHSYTHTIYNTDTNTTPDIPIYCVHTTTTFPTHVPYIPHTTYYRQTHNTNISFSYTNTIYYTTYTHPLHTTQGVFFRPVTLSSSTYPWSLAHSQDVLAFPGPRKPALKGLLSHHIPEAWEWIPTPCAPRCTVSWKAGAIPLLRYRSLGVMSFQI